MDNPVPEKKAVRVTVFNQTVTLSTTGDPRDLEEVGKVVDELVRGIASRTGTMDSSRATLLACLHLADQLRAAEKQLEEIRARVAGKHEQFRALLDQAVDA